MDGLGRPVQHLLVLLRQRRRVLFQAGRLDLFSKVCEEGTGCEWPREASDGAYAALTVQQMTCRWVNDSREAVVTSTDRLPELYVNQMISSQVRWTHLGIRVDQQAGGWVWMGEGGTARCHCDCRKDIVPFNRVIPAAVWLHTHLLPRALSMNPTPSPNSPA